MYLLLRLDRPSKNFWVLTPVDALYNRSRKYKDGASHLLSVINAPTLINYNIKLYIPQ